MTNGTASFPPDFRQISAKPPEGWELSSRLLQPEIYIRRKEAGFEFRLVGTKTVRGEKKVWDAPGPDYNWVADGNVIRPLPHDTPAVVQQIMDRRQSNPLSFPDVVRLIRLENPDIPITAEENVFNSARFSAAALRSSETVPGLQATLFPYQAQGVTWMDQTIRHTGGLVLADEMGLGKTIQIIALLLSAKPEISLPALIICPTSLIANWRKEIMNFAPELSVLVHRGHDRTGVTTGLQRAQIVLSTYDTVVNDISIFSGMTWSWLICDEAQALKNPDSQRRQAVALIPRHRTIPMTGTPVETSLLDLWSLADLAIPGLLGSRQDFEADNPDTEESAKDLSRLTDPIVLCRKVSDVAGDLPERIDIDLPLELGDELSQRYDEVLEETLVKHPVAGNLVATGQLQLFCAHPWLRGLGDPDRDQDAEINPSTGMPLLTPKVERTISILEETFRSGRKALLFAIFNRCDEIIREATRGRLPDAFWGVINGSTPQEDRQAIVDAFSGHDGPGCLVLNPKAAGAGLNITAATVVIHFTQSWNPAIESQASARAHRRGQTEPVYIYRLFYENTVERVMIDRSQWRRKLGNEAVPVSTRDRDDLKRALSLRPSGGK